MRTAAQTTVAILFNLGASDATGFLPEQDVAGDLGRTAGRGAAGGPSGRARALAVPALPVRGGAVLMRVWPGSPRPLGATWDGEGVNFAIFSENATAVQLLLFDDADSGTPSATVSLHEVTDRVWHAYLPDVRPGDLYGYKIDGPYEPSSGHRFNNRKLLIDPYAKAVSGLIDWDDDLFGYTVGDEEEDLSFDPRDSSARMPKSVVVDPAFTWGDDRPPRTPWNRTVIYEAHVRGMTMQHQGIPPTSARNLPGHGLGPRRRSSAGAGRHRHRTHAGAPLRLRSVARRQGIDELLGLQLHRLLRPARRLRHGWAGQTGLRVQVDGEDAAPGRH